MDLDARGAVVPGERERVARDDARIEARRDAVADPKLSLLAQSVALAARDRLEAAVESRERARLLRLRHGGRAQPLPEGERLLDDRRSRRRAVAGLTGERDTHGEPAFVRDGSRVPAGGLSDDAPVRRGQRRAVPRAGARRRLLFDRADHGDAHALYGPRGRRDERGERTLRVNRAAAHEPVTFDAPRDPAA